jgi:hypothetical protein
MKTEIVFLLQLGGLTSLTLSVLAFLHRSIERLLVELCGTLSRARFWLVLFEALTCLAVLFTALLQPPANRLAPNGPDFFDYLSTIRGGLIGLMGSLALLAVCAWSGIGRYERRHPAQPAGSAPWAEREPS